MNTSVTHPPEVSSPVTEEVPGGSHAPDAPSRRSENFDTRTHSRHRRLASMLDSCSEQPDFLFDLVGVDRIAEALSIPAAAVQRMMEARPGVRRRLAKRARLRLGLSMHHLEAARHLPDDPGELLRAAHYFAIAIRMAGTRRVMPRAAFQALSDRYGAEAVAFGISKQTLLGPNAEILAEYQQDETPSTTDLRLFVRSLAALGHAGAAIVALKLGLPVSLATAQVANIDLALETRLPEVALSALDSVSDGALKAVNAADEAAWQSDASQDGGTGEDGSRDNYPDEEPSSSPDSTEAA